MTQPEKPTDLLTRLGQLGAPELRRLLVEHLTKRKLGLTWERNAIEHDEVLNADIVLPRLDASRKAQRTPKIYGKVLFVTREDTRLRIVNDDGSLGDEFDWVDLTPAWKWMAARRSG